jgi:hypothetical protein
MVSVELVWLACAGTDVGRVLLYVGEKPPAKLNGVKK